MFTGCHRDHNYIILERIKFQSQQREKERETKKKSAMLFLTFFNFVRTFFFLAFKNNVYTFFKQSTLFIQFIQQEYPIRITSYMDSKTYVYNYNLFEQINTRTKFKL